MTAARAALADIDAALFRLAIGRFGVCQRCGRAIPADRLQAIPMASLCLRCQLSKELGNSLTCDPWRTATIPPASPSHVDPLAGHRRRVGRGFVPGQRPAGELVSRPVGTSQAGDSDPLHEQLTHVGAHQDRPWSLTPGSDPAEPAAAPRRPLACGRRASG